MRSPPQRTTPSTPCSSCGGFGGTYAARRPLQRPARLRQALRSPRPCRCRARQERSALRRRPRQ
eukprot:4743505-Alexandrium_andersonii.AAC.1